MQFKEYENEIKQYIPLLTSGSLSERLRASLDGKALTRDEKLAGFCQSFLGEILDRTSEYDALTTIARANWGARIQEIVHNKDTSGKALGNLAAGLAQYAREFSIKSHFALKPGGEALIRYFEPSNPELDSEDKSYADYITYGLPRDILQEAIRAHSFQLEEHEQKVKNWQMLLGQWEGKVTAHEATLKSQQQRYNFVGLAKAFSQMYEHKASEKDRLLAIVSAFGLVLLLPIVAQLPIGDSIPYLSGLKVTWAVDQWPKVLPLITLEVVNLYFFRIFLHNFYSAKAQLLQLDLRQALCAFVESYVDFAKDKQPQKDANPLAKFEALVFSGLTPDPDRVPSSFDGLEQLVQMAKEFKK